MAPGGVPRRRIYDDMDTAVDRAWKDKNLEVNTHFAAKVNTRRGPIIATRTPSGLEARQHNFCSTQCHGIAD